MSPKLFHLPPESLRAMAQYFLAIGALCQLRAREAEANAKIWAKANADARAKGEYEALKRWQARDDVRVRARELAKGMVKSRPAYDSDKGGTAAAVRPGAESGERVQSRAARK